MKRITNVCAAIASAITFGTMASASPLTCESTPDEVFDVYQAGSRDKVGNMLNYQSEPWYTTRLQNPDVNVLKIVWFATGDWAAADIPLSSAKGVWWSANKRLPGASEKLQKAINTLCENPAVDSCAKMFTGPSECTAFYENRYSKVKARLDTFTNELLASPFLGQATIARSRAEKDFGVVPENTLLIGNYVAPDQALRKVPYPRFQLAQANLRAVDKVTAASKKTAPVPLTRGEFETTEAFNARTAQYEATAKQVNAPSFKDALEQELNAYHVPKIASGARYDADKGTFSIDVTLQQSEEQFPFSVAVPISEAPKVKRGLTDTKDFSEIYSVWLVYESKNSLLTLKGGYLMLLAGIDKGLYVMQPVEKPFTMATGHAAGTAFRPKFQAALKAAAEQEKQQKALAAEQNAIETCNRFRAALGDRHRAARLACGR